MTEAVTDKKSFQFTIDIYKKFADGIELDEDEVYFLKNYLKSLVQHLETLRDRYAEDDIKTLKTLRRFVDGFELTDVETDFLKKYMRELHDACRTE